MQCIAQRLKQIRENEGLTQAQFAEKVNISHASIKNYESGRREIPGHLLRNVAEAYNVSMDYLTGLTDKPYAFRSDLNEAAKLYFSLTETDKLRIEERMHTLKETAKGPRTLRPR